MNFLVEWFYGNKGALCCRRRFETYEDAERRAVTYSKTFGMALLTRDGGLTTVWRNGRVSHKLRLAEPTLVI